MKLPFTVDFAKAGKYLLAITTSLLIIQNKRVWFFKPFEIFLILAGITTFLYFFPKRIRELKHVEWKNRKNYGAVLIFFSSILLATIISYVRYGTTFDYGGYYGGFLYLLRFLAIIASFVLIYVYSTGDKKFHNLIWCTFLAPLFFVFALTIPKWAYQFQIALGNGRFYGFAEPVITATSILICFSFLCAAFFEAVRAKRLNFGAICFFGSAISAALLLWTQTRGHWLGMGAATLFIIILTARRSSANNAGTETHAKNKRNFFKKFLINSILAIALFATSFSILPVSVKTAAVLRLFPQYITKYWNSTNGFASLNSSDFNGLVGQIEVNKSAAAQAARSWFSNNEIRPKLWLEYLNVFIRNPLGLGLNRMTPDLLVKFKTDLRSPHNTPLDIATWGGLGALGAVAYLLYRAFANCRKKFNEENSRMRILYLGIAAALIGICVASLFDTLTFSRPIWILLAIALT